MYHERTSNFSNHEWHLHQDVVIHGYMLDSNMKSINEKLGRIHERMAVHWKRYSESPWRIKPRETLVWNNKDWI